MAYNDRQSQPTTGKVEPAATSVASSKPEDKPAEKPASNGNSNGTGLTNTPVSKTETKNQDGSTTTKIVADQSGAIDRKDPAYKAIYDKNKADHPKWDENMLRTFSDATHRTNIARQNAGK